MIELLTLGALAGTLFYLCQGTDTGRKGKDRLDWPEILLVLLALMLLGVFK